MLLLYNHEWKYKNIYKRVFLDSFSSLLVFFLLET